MFTHSEGTLKIKFFIYKRIISQKKKKNQEFFLQHKDNVSQAGIKIARRNSNNLRYADDTTLMAESEEELKSHLMKARGE